LPAGKKHAGAFHDTVCGFLRREFGGLDAQVREAFVERLALVEQTFELGFGVFLAVEQRAIVVHRRAACETLRIGVQPDDVTEMTQDGEIAWLGDDAAAGGDDAPAFAEKGAQRGGFMLAESSLPLGGKDVGNAFAGGIDDEMIGIDNLEADHLRDNAAHGRFARAHQANEQDVRLPVQGDFTGSLHQIENGGGKIGVIAQGIEIARVAWFPAGGMQFGVGDAFVAPAAFAIGVRLASSGQFEAKLGAQMFQALPLRHLGVIHDVVDATQALRDEMHECGGGVIGVDLIEDAALAVIAFDGGLPLEQILQYK
jgi:hypothetical protein